MKSILRIAGLGIAILLTSCGTTRICKMPYLETELLVLNRLGINKQELTQTSWRSTQIHVNDQLKKDMHMGIYSVDLKDYDPTNHISFVAYQEYDIGANGGEYIDFSITMIDEHKTKVFVDYSDRAVGCCIALPLPFAYINPGIIGERNIMKYILQENTTKESADKALLPARVP